MNLHELNRELSDEVQNNINKKVMKEKTIENKFNIYSGHTMIGHIQDDCYTPANTECHWTKKEMSLLLDFMNTQPKYNIILFHNNEPEAESFVMVSKASFGYRATICPYSSAFDSEFQFTMVEIKELIQSNPKYSKTIRASIKKVSD